MNLKNKSAVILFPFRQAILIFLLLISGYVFLFPEVYAGGIVELQYSFLGSSEDPFSASTEFSGVFSPRMNIGTDSVSLALEGEISWEGEEFPELEVSELVFSGYPFDFMMISAGRFLHLPGSGEFFSNTNFFVRTDFLSFVERQGKGMHIPGDMLQAVFYGDEFYLRLTSSLFPREHRIPDVDSPWFPMGDIPETTFSFSRGTLIRRELEVSSPERPDTSLRNLSFSPEFGGTLFGIDFSLIYFHGWDDDLLVTLSFEYPEGDGFNAVVNPVYRKIDAAGMNLAVSGDAFRLWLDGAGILNKTFVTKTVNLSSNTTILTEAPFAELTLGGSYELETIDTLVLLEWHQGWIFSQEATIIEPMLNSSLTAMISSSFFDYRLIPSLFVLYSLEDNSWMGTLQASWSPSEEFSFDISLAFFSGEKTTNLGQFGQNFLLSCALHLGF